MFNYHLVLRIYDVKVNSSENIKVTVTIQTKIKSWIQRFIYQSNKLILRIDKVRLKRYQQKPIKVSMGQNTQLA